MIVIAHKFYIFLQQKYRFDDYEKKIDPRIRSFMTEVEKEISQKTYEEKQALEQSQVASNRNYSFIIIFNSFIQIYIQIS